MTENGTTGACSKTQYINIIFENIQDILVLVVAAPLLNKLFTAYIFIISTVVLSCVQLLIFSSLPLDFLAGL